MDLKTAYKILHVQENCSMEELTKQYYALTENKLKRDELEKIQHAYNTIRADIEAKTPQQKPTFGEKAKDFLFIYRSHLVIGLIALFVVGTIGFSVIKGQIQKSKESNLPTPDIEILLFGNFDSDLDMTKIENQIYGDYSNWKRVETQLVYAPTGVDAQLSYAEQQKSSVMLATEKPDIYIFDREHYEQFLDDDAFVTLDDVFDDQSTNEQLLTYQPDNEKNEHIYGVDLTDSSLFKNTTIEDNTKIAVIRKNAKQLENAKQFLLDSVK